MKIPKWQHELARYYKRGKLVSYFLNIATKTCLYGLKISENIEIGHFFQSRTFFHLSSKLHTSCLSAFKYLLFTNTPDVKKHTWCENELFLVTFLIVNSKGWKFNHVSLKKATSFPVISHSALSTEYCVVTSYLAKLFRAIFNRN